MGFADEYLEVRVTNLTVDKYINLGYDCKIGDILKISPKHAPNNYDVCIRLSCDICGDIHEIKCGSFCNTNKERDGKYICKKCHKEMMSNRKCSICGSKHQVTMYASYGDLLCGKHKYQIRKNGKILDRTLWDGNEIFIYENHAEFYTYDREYNVNGVFKIDLDMVDFVKSHKMHKHKNGYATYKMEGTRKNKRLHRYIMGLENTSDMVVDHINGDKYDNRRENLRVTNHRVNNINVKGDYSHNTSGVTGVHICKDGINVESYIHKNNKKISLYHGKSLEDAIRAREVAELEYFGEYSPRYEYLIEKYEGFDIDVGKYV